VSSRIRLARNLEEIPFSHWATSSDLERIAESVREAMPASPHLKDGHLLCIDDLDSLDRQFLEERYLISREFLKGGIQRYVVVHPEQTVSLMINEEDHIRLQMIMAGMNLRALWKTIDEIDTELEKNLPFSFSTRLGYLTACPTNVGTGIRCSVMVHLPALVMTRRIEQVFHAVTHMGCTVRGYAGEGSDIVGNLFQLSNQWTLGITENDTLTKLEALVDNILNQERIAEAELYHENKMKIEDRVWRAYATLSQARVLSSGEAIELFSIIRLGRSLEILDSPAVQRINEMMIETRPAHLQKRAGSTLTAMERDVCRAKLIRDWFNDAIRS
jgi:protein arginine kinase